MMLGSFQNPSAIRKPLHYITAFHSTAALIIFRKPKIDGGIAMKGSGLCTFAPQNIESLPESVEFISKLVDKASKLQ
jgi:hypothetical protein